MAVRCPQCVRLAIPELRNGYWVGGLAVSILMAGIVLFAELGRSLRSGRG